MNWYIGQRIVAIVDHGQGRFKKGDQFRIRSLRTAPCNCGIVEIDIGMVKSYSITQCGICERSYFDHTMPAFFWEGCFSPIDEIESFDISELTELLTNDNITYEN